MWLSPCTRELAKRCHATTHASMPPALRRRRIIREPGAASATVLLLLLMRIRTWIWLATGVKPASYGLPVLYWQRVAKYGKPSRDELLMVFQKGSAFACRYGTPPRLCHRFTPTHAYTGLLYCLHNEPHRSTKICVSDHIPANTRRSAIVGTMLAQCRRRWNNIVLILVERFARIYLLVGLMYSMLVQWFTNVCRVIIPLPESMTASSYDGMVWVDLTLKLRV